MKLNLSTDKFAVIGIGLIIVTIYVTVYITNRQINIVQNSAQFVSHTNEVPGGLLS